MKMSIKVRHKNLIQWGLIFFLGLLFVPLAQGQEKSPKDIKKSRSLVRKAERAKAEDKFAEAEADYRRALSKDLKNAEASYNFSHLYGDKEMDVESMNQLFKTAKNATSKSLKHKAYHNLGNAYMSQKDYAQAVKAYKDALRNNPGDDETRYNLAVAQDMLEKNPDQNEDNDQDQNEDQDQDNENSRDNKESQDQEQDENDDQDDDQDQQDQNDEQDQDEDQQAGSDEQDQDNDENQGEEEQQDQQPQEPNDDLSDEQAENLLRAAENLEKDVQKKLNEDKGEKIPPKPNQKDW